MAKMYGDRGREQWDSPDNKTKSSLKHREERLVFKEFEEEMHDPHANGICYNPNGQGYGCEYCYGEDYDGNGPEDLEGIEGVTFGEARKD